VIAFLNAPLWVPAIAAGWTTWILAPDAPRGLIPITAAIAGVLGYGGTLVIGAPLCIVMRARRRTSFWMALVAGFGAGAATWLIFVGALALWFGGSSMLVVHNTLIERPPAGAAVPCGVVGIIVGATLWLIARPDRA